MGAVCSKTAQASQMSLWCMVWCWVRPEKVSPPATLLAKRLSLESCAQLKASGAISHLPVHSLMSIGPRAFETSALCSPEDRTSGPGARIQMWGCGVSVFAPPRPRAQQEI